MLMLNAGAALYAADVTATLKEGVALAGRMLDEGLARAKLAQFLEISR
jgi:anthranilate phosphoribosyltransferase